MKTILFAACVLLIALPSALSAEIQRFNVPILDSPQKGSADAPVTIIEFLDFQ